VKFPNCAELKMIISAIFLIISVCTTSLVLAWGANLVQNYRPRNPITGGVRIDTYYMNERPFMNCSLGFAASWAGAYGFVTASHCYNFTAGNVWCTHQPYKAYRCTIPGIWCGYTDDNLISKMTWGSILQYNRTSGQYQIYFDFSFLPNASNVLTKDQILPPQIIMVNGSNIVKLTVNYFASYSYATSGSTPRTVYKTGRTTGTTMLAYHPRYNVTRVPNPNPPNIWINNTVCYSSRVNNMLIYTCAHWIYMYRPSFFGLQEPSAQQSEPIVCQGDSGAPVFEYNSGETTIFGIISGGVVGTQWQGPDGNTYRCTSGRGRQSFVLVLPVYDIPYIQPPPGVTWR